MSKTDATLLKVRKLLALAEDPAATPAEAEAFTAKATQLMADYGIDQALLANAAPDGKVIGERVVRFNAPYARDKCSLVCGIAHVMRCKAVILGSDLSLSVHLFGLESDLVCVEMLTTSLLLQGSRELAVTVVPRHENVAAYRRSWWAGFSAAIGKRLTDQQKDSINAAEERLADSGTSVSLVLADRTHEAEAAMHRAYPRLKNASRRRLTGGGTRDGYTSGQRADLGTGQRVGQRRSGELAG